MVAEAMGAKLAAVARTEPFGELHGSGMGSQGGAGGGGSEGGGVVDHAVAWCPGGRVEKVVASAPTSHQTVNLKEEVC